MCKVVIESLSAVEPSGVVLSNVMCHWCQCNLGAKSILESIGAHVTRLISLARPVCQWRYMADPSARPKPRQSDLYSCF